MKGDTYDEWTRHSRTSRRRIPRPVSSAGEASTGRKKGLGQGREEILAVPSGWAGDRLPGQVHSADRPAVSGNAGAGSDGSCSFLHCHCEGQQGTDRPRHSRHALQSPAALGVGATDHRTSDRRKALVSCQVSSCGRGQIHMLGPSKSGSLSGSGSAHHDTWTREAGRLPPIHKL